MGIINTKEQLENAIEKGEHQVMVFGDFAKMIISIKLTEKIAWTVAIISLSTAICFIITASSFSVGILRTRTIVAIGIAFVAGCIGFINKMKNNYLIVEKGENYVKLKL